MFSLGKHASSRSMAAKQYHHEPYLLSLTPRTERPRPCAASMPLSTDVIHVFLAANPPRRRAQSPFRHSRRFPQEVPYTQPDATPETKTDETTSLKIRPLFVDDRQKEWTTGDIHDITDRTFTVRRALRLNDALPTDAAPHWTWQPGPWLSIDRVTGHITALHLPDFDAAVSDVVWFRDYAAYCGIATTAKGGLYAIVAQLSLPPVVQKQIGPWPQSNHFIPVCQPHAVAAPAHARHDETHRWRSCHLRRRQDRLYRRRGRLRTELTAKHSPKIPEDLI